jgi:hypothetical protein
MEIHDLGTVSRTHSFCNAGACYNLYLEELIFKLEENELKHWFNLI